MLNFIHGTLLTIADQQRPRRSGRQILARLAAGLGVALLLAIVWTTFDGWTQAEELAAAVNRAASFQADPYTLLLLAFGAVTLGLTVYFVGDTHQWLAYKLAQLLARLCQRCGATAELPPKRR